MTHLSPTQRKHLKAERFASIAWLVQLAAIGYGVGWLIGAPSGGIVLGSAIWYRLEYGGAAHRAKSALDDARAESASREKARRKLDRMIAERGTTR